MYLDVQLVDDVIDGGIGVRRLPEGTCDGGEDEEGSEEHFSGRSVWIETGGSSTEIEPRSSENSSNKRKTRGPGRRCETQELERIVRACARLRYSRSHARAFEVLWTSSEIPKLEGPGAVARPIMRCVIAKAARFQLGPWGNWDQGCIWRIRMGCHIYSNTHGTVAVNIVFEEGGGNDQLFIFKLRTDNFAFPLLASIPTTTTAVNVCLKWR